MVGTYDKVQLTEQEWGTVKHLKTGEMEQVKKYTWTNANKVKVEVISYGVIVTSIFTPDKSGKVKDIVLGFDNIEGYLRKDNPYFGAAIGRVANRVGNGTFILNGKAVKVSKNFAEKHQLHGGFIGFDKLNWNSYIAGKKVIFTLHSPDKDEGYPGDLIATVTASLDDSNNFQLVFNAWTTKPTPVNLTNHSYFNLAGHESGQNEIYAHTVTINADKITETDSDSIPSGVLLEVADTPYDLRHATKLGPALAELDNIGFDDNFCIASWSLGKLCPISKVVHDASGRMLEVFSDQPGVQFYTANYMPDPKNEIRPTGAKVIPSPNQDQPIPGKGGAKYFRHGAFCLETQLFPDSANHSNFPNSILNPGATYSHTVIYKFGVVGK